MFDRLIANDEKMCSEQETISEKQIAVLLKLTGNIIKLFRSSNKKGKGIPQSLNLNMAFFDYFFFFVFRLFNAK